MPVKVAAPRALKVPVTFRTYNRAALALLPSLPWGPDTMGAYDLARGWHEALPDMVARGRPCTPEEVASLMPGLSEGLGGGVKLAPLARVPATVHEARLVRARELLEEQPTT